MLAPILVSVYTRLYQLERCIASLRLNAQARDSDLYVVSDAARSDADQEKVAAVRAFIANVDGYRSVTAINRPANLGFFLSINQAIDLVIEKHGRVIFLEDDNWVAPNFLRFVNDGLDFYQDDASVFSVSGYNFPIRMPAAYQYDVYGWQGFTAWGVGLWRDRWQTVDWSADALRNTLMDEKKVRKINQVAEHLVPIARASLQRNQLVTDVIASIDVINTNRFSVFPAVSKVRNLGNDGSGAHGGFKNLYTTQPIDSGEPYQFTPDLGPDDEINRILRQHYTIPLNARMISVLSPFVPTRQKKWLKKLATGRKVRPG